MQHRFFQQKDTFSQPAPAAAEKENNGFFRGQNEQALEQATDAPIATEPLLTETQVRDAIRYIRTSYAPQSIRLLRQRFELAEGDAIDRDLVLAIAQFQTSNDLTVDGKLGPGSFNSLQSEGGEVMQDVVLFRVTSPLGGRMEMIQGGSLTSMVGHFFVEIRLPPGENCADYQYRQYICGKVEMLPANGDPAGPMTDLSSLYNKLPGGQLPAIPNYREDGDTAIPSQYGHREQPGRPENHYLNEDGRENQRSGCIFKSFDRPGITDRICRPGELYNFDFRFRGEVRHKDRGVIAVRYWSVTDNFSIL
jgi:hypothetical protein